jgi:hypothetical protein
MNPTQASNWPASLINWAMGKRFGQARSAAA